MPSGRGSTPVAASRSFTSWDAVALAHSVAIRSTIGCGVAAGAMKPYQPEPSDTAGLRKPVNYVNPKAVVKPKTPDTLAVVPQKDTTKPVVDTEKVVVVPKPVTVTYRVQIISSDKPLKEKAAEFKGVTDTWHYQMKGTYKYTAGSYKTQEEAVKRQNELRKGGFSEAFVVAFDSNGKRLTLEEAKKLAGAK